MIAELFNRLDVSVGWCVELGAWDGKHLSNSWSLWARSGWSAVLLEGEPERAAALAAEVADRDDVVVIAAYVAPDGPQSLDALLASTPIPDEFALLSLDIDGDDFHVWEGLARHRPRVVVVEYNATFPVDLEFVQPRGAYVGSSALALTRLGEKKGYRVLAVTSSNLLFAREVDIERIGLETPDLAELCDASQIPIVYSDFAGHHVVVRTGPWGYLDASRQPDASVGAALRDTATVARRRMVQRAPWLSAAYRSLRGRRG